MNRVRFEEEALELSDQVYRVARRLVGSREEAEDLVQDTYARAFRSWQQYTPGTNLRAWLLRILTNLNIDRGRRLQRTPDTQPLEEGDYFLYNKLESTISDENPDEERVIERLSQNSVVEALAEVPHDFRDVVVLVDIGEFSYADAAQILDIPVGTVMSRLAPRPARAEAEPGREGGDRVDGLWLSRLRGDDAAVPRRHALRRGGRRRRRSISTAARRCEKRYRFEEHLRHFVRVAVDEPMPASLQQRLDELRTTRPSAPEAARPVSGRGGSRSGVSTSPGGVRSSQGTSVHVERRARRRRGCATSGARDAAAGWPRDAVVARGDEVGLAPVLEHALDRPRVEVGPVGEHDERGLDVGAERARARSAGSRRGRAPSPGR